MSIVLSCAAIKRGALAKAGELIDGSSSYDARALDYLNRLYNSFLAGGNEFDVDLGLPWSWAKQATPSVFVLQPAVSLAANLTLNSASGTFTTTPTVSYNGYYLKVSGYPTYYLITHSANSASFTLDVGAVDVGGSALSVTLYPLDYQIGNASVNAGIQRLIAPMRVYRDQFWDGDDEGKIYGCSYDQMTRDFPLHRLESGVPTLFAEQSKTSEGFVTIRVNRIVSVATKVEYDFIPNTRRLRVVSFADAAVNYATSTFTIADISANALLPIFFESDGNLINGLTVGTRYYPVNISGSSFQIAATPAGTPITGMSAGDGAYWVSNEPLIPADQRDVLTYGVAALLMIDKVDPRAQDMAALVKAKLHAMIRAYSQETVLESKNKGRLIPRQDRYSLFKRYVRQEPTS